MEASRNASPVAVRRRVLVTGANSGLGFAICTRLIDEFLDTHPSSNDRLTIILTTRGSKKAQETVERLESHIASISRHRSPASSRASHCATLALIRRRIQLQPEHLDLCDLKSVKALSRKLTSTGQRIHALVLNAGIGGWEGLNWPLAIWSILTDPIQQLTWPVYKRQSAPHVLEGVQSSEQKETLSESGERMGAVFTANVFGHYFLSHELMPALSIRQSSEQNADGSVQEEDDAPDEPSRIIWVSSLEAYASSFMGADDIQGLSSPLTYESSKRLTDLLALSFAMPELAPFTGSFSSSKAASSPEHDRASNQARTEVDMYVSHPGICATSILPLHWILVMSQIASFYIARWLGSPWHTIDAYKGAVAMVWLSLAPREQITESIRSFARNATLAVGQDGKLLNGDASNSAMSLEVAGPAKWGSATDSRGQERVERTEVEGWGYGGVVGDSELVDRRGRARVRKGRRRGAEAVTKERREQFVQQAREIWQEMERLRLYWDQRLD